MHRQRCRKPGQFAAELLCRIALLVCAVTAAVLVAPSVQAEVEERAVLVVIVEPGGSGLSPAAVRGAVAAELGIDVASAPVAGALGVITVHIPDGNVEMTYQSREGGEVSRTIDLPEDPERKLEVIGLLAENLARDEAGELLEHMRKADEAAEEEQPPDEAAAEEAKEAAPTPAEKPQAPPAKPKKPAVEPTPPATTPQAEASEEAKPPPLRPVNLSLVHPIALHPDSERYRFNFELGLIYGRVGGIQGLGVTALLGQVDGQVEGVSFSGIWTKTGGLVKGLQAAGIGNQAQGELRGADVAGIFNTREGAVYGVQGAGIFNLTDGPIQGLQAAGVFSMADGAVEGLQFAALNTAADVNGAQIGVMNIGRRVSGTQIGLVNICDEIDGIPIGVVNVVAKGKTHALTWSDTSTYANAGVKYLNSHLYTILAAGFLPEPDELAGSFAIGGEIPFGKLFLDLDLMFTYKSRFRPGFEDDDNFVRLRAIGGYELTRGLSVFAGGGAEMEEELRSEFHFRPYGLAGVQLF